MIIDSLTHVTPDGRWFGTEHDASESRLLREMEAAGVDRAVVVALAGHIPNEFVLEVCQRHARQLVPGVAFNPGACASSSEAVREFRAQLGGVPFRVIKLHPRLNGFDPLDPRCQAVLEELASWECGAHVWLDSLLYGRGQPLRRPLVDTLHELVGRWTSLTFVLLHAGGSWVLQLAEALRDCPNAILDISFTMRRFAGSSVSSDLAYLLRTFDRRVVFGSDFPEVSIGDALESFRELGYNLASEKRDNVLGGNLARLLKED